MIKKTGVLVFTCTFTVSIFSQNSNQSMTQNDTQSNTITQKMGGQIKISSSNNKKLYLKKIEQTNTLQDTLLGLTNHHPRVLAKFDILVSKMKITKFKGGVYPDPKFGVAWSNLPYRKNLPMQYDRTPMTGIEFKLSQPIPFPGKLSAEADVSNAELQSARIRLALEKNDLSKEFIETLVSYRLQSDLLELTSLMASKVQLIAKSSRSSYATGRLSLDRVQFADIASERFEDRKSEESGSIKRIQKKFKYFVDVEGVEIKNLFAVAKEKSLSVYFESLQSSYDRDSCDLKKCSLLVAMEGAWLSREKSLRTRSKYNYAPDMEVFASYRKRERVENDPVIGEDFYSFGFTMKIPLWSALSNHNKVGSHSSMVKSRQHSSHDILERERSRLAQLNEDLETYKDRIERYRTRLIPNARSALFSLRNSYQNGRSDLYDLLGAYEILYLVQSEYLHLSAKQKLLLLSRAWLLNTILPVVKKKETYVNTEK